MNKASDVWERGKDCDKRNRIWTKRMKYAHERWNGTPDRATPSNAGFQQKAHNAEKRENQKTHASQKERNQ
jgi:hypothetical protein